MTNWPEHHLGEFFRIKHGFAFKGEFFAKEGEYVVLTPGNFRAEGGLKLRGEKEKYYSAEPPQAFVLRSGDLLTVMTDLTQEARILGASAVVTEGGRFLHNQRLGKIIELDAGNLEKLYLYHLFNWEGIRAQIRASATGSTVRHTAPARIYEILTPLPPLPIQKRIAAILSAYDDLIEVNTHRIAILEEMAGRIYEEWFVRGADPSWPKVPLSDLAKLRSGYAFKSKSYSTDHGLPLITIKHVQDNGFSRDGASLIPQTPSNMPEYCTLGEGDVLMSLTGNIGRVCRVFGGPCLLNQRVAKVESEAVLLPYVYLLIKSSVFQQRMAALATGVAQQNLSPVKTQALTVARPSDVIVSSFALKAGPLLALELVLRKTNANLHAQRDLLLPRLVSGKLDVFEAEEAQEAIPA